MSGASGLRKHTHASAGQGGTLSGVATSGAVTTSGLTQATGKLLGRSTASTGAIEEITVGSNLTLSAGTLSATGGGGGGGWETITSGSRLEAGRDFAKSTEENVYLGLYNGSIEIHAVNGYVYVEDGVGVDIRPDTGDVVDISGGDGLVLPPAAAADPTAIRDGHLYLNSVSKQIRQRVNGEWHGVGNGWAPYVYPPNFVADGVYTTAHDLAAAGGSMLVPVLVPSWMKCSGIEFWNTDTTLARDVEVAIYGNDLNNSASLARLTDSNDFGGWTASAASLKGVAYATANPVRLSPGIYWVGIRNDNASNTLGIGTLAASSQMANNSYQTKTLASLGSTLDMTAATWTKYTAIPAVRLAGRVFGQTGQF